MGDGVETADDEARRDIHRMSEEVWLSCQEHVAVAAMWARIVWMPEDPDAMRGRLTSIREEMDAIRAHIASIRDELDAIELGAEEATHDEAGGRDVLGGLNVRNR